MINGLFEIYYLIFRIMGTCMQPEQRFIRCQNCGIVGNSNTMRTHQCQPQQNQQNKSYSHSNNSHFTQNNVGVTVPSQPPNKKKDIFMPFLKTVFPPPPNKFQYTLYKGQAKQFTTEFVTVKVPTSAQRTQFQWKRENTVTYPLSMKKLQADVIRHRTFQEKMLWFRLNMEDLRVSWQNGCQKLQIDRGNIIYSSLNGLKKINLKKELKIIFDDEVVADAGGLLRQWMHLIIQEIFKPETGIFQLCKTDQTAYKIVWDSSLNFEYAEPHLKLLGIIIGKALFQRVSLNCYLNRSIWRQISGFTVFLHDAYSYDKDMYTSWKMILDEPGSENLCLEFYEIKSHSNGHTQEIELVQGGKKIAVTDDNKDQYIFHLVQLHCCRSIKRFIKVLMEGLHSVIPESFLSVFQPFEFQMLLNGPQFIDVEDWKANTMYKGYKHSDQVVVWFWQVVAQYDQQKLANLLHYCTGSNRVPILGFKYLQSNRNTINKFTIQKVPVQKFNPYPRSYTCFNRLELPEYKSKKQLQQKLKIVINQKITHFGLD